VTESTAKSTARKRIAGAPDDDAAESGADSSITAEVATYELARDELAAVVHKLESGGLSLDESLTLWERGEHLAGVCSRFLDNARERVESALARADEQ
jgi:exodeoxyribonuclease VII small subunit